MNVNLGAKTLDFFKVQAPPSKSMAHRAMIAAMLSQEACAVENVALSDDVNATLQAAVALGKNVRIERGRVELSGGQYPPLALIDCRESGSTLRFLMPVCAALGVTTTFSGSGKLPQRPYDILAEVMSKKGVSFDKTAGLPVTICGKLQSGVFEIAGDVSSQFITGLLFALPLLDGDSEIVLTSPLQSAGYVDLTLLTLKRFGVEIQKTPNGFFVKGGQKYSAKSFSVEGDYSNAAFWIVLGALNNGCEVFGLDKDSLQGDRAIIEQMRQMGAEICVENDKVTVKKAKLKGTVCDVGQIPDLAPIISVAMACAEGKSRIVNAARLKIKESNRLQAIFDDLSAAGVKAKLGDDFIEICGSEKIAGGNANGFNDHRIVMSMAVLATKTQGGMTVTDAQAVAKSYPDFFEQYEKLGGQVNVVNLG